MPFTKVFTEKNWNISINDRRTELMFDNGYQCAYASLDRDKRKFFFDRTIVPKYAHQKALKWALTPGNMVSIYSDI